MSIRPGSIPTWATAGSGIVEPTDAKKVLGWGATGASGERPPAQYFNWMQNLNGEWLRYLSYDFLIDDDFIDYQSAGLSHPSGTNQATGFDYRVFRVHGRTDSWGTVPVTSESPAYGLAKWQPAASSVGYLLGRVQQRPSLSHSWRFESAIATTPSTARGSGISMQLGLLPNLINSASGFYGFSGGAYFASTGNSGAWTFYCGVTALNTGIHPTLNAASGFQTMSIDNRGTTMYVELKCPLSGNYEATISGLDPFEGWGSQNFALVGFQGLCHAITPIEPNALIDYVRFGVKR